MNSFIFTDSDTLSLSINNKAYNVDNTNPNWEAIIAALKANDFEVIPGLINQANALEEFTETADEGYENITVDVEYGTITYGGEPIHTTIVDHIFRMKEEGFNITPMLRFLDNLLSNPSKRAVDELYGFLQYGKMPITEDGCFIAYKRVRSDYKSVHDGKTDNSIGAIVQMPRNMVNENSHETCSTGLHFCSHEYLRHFSGAKIVILKVNPRDVVSIPADYNNTKGRACRYEVVGELSREEFDRAMTGNVFVDAVHNGNAPAQKAEPKPALSAYIKYNSGYTDAQEGNGYDDGDEWNDFADDYEEGYDDYCDGNERRFEAPAVTPASTMTNSIEQVKALYNEGYKDGRSRQVARKPREDAYMDGYKDGKNHRARKYW